MPGGVAHIDIASRKPDYGGQLKLVVELFRVLRPPHWLVMSDESCRISFKRNWAVIPFRRNLQPHLAECDLQMIFERCKVTQHRNPDRRPQLHVVKPIGN